MADLFHETKDGSLDRKYLRVCSVYKIFMRQKRVTKERAIELLRQKKVGNEKALVEMWERWPPQSLFIRPLS